MTAGEFQSLDGKALLIMKVHDLSFDRIWANLFVSAVIGFLELYDKLSNGIASCGHSDFCFKQLYWDVIHPFKVCNSVGFFFLVFYVILKIVIKYI